MQPQQSVSRNEIFQPMEIYPRVLCVSVSSTFFHARWRRGANQVQHGACCAAADVKKGEVDCITCHLRTSLTLISEVGAVAFVWRALLLSEQLLEHL